MELSFNLILRLRGDLTEPSVGQIITGPMKQENVERRVGFHIEPHAPANYRSDAKAKSDFEAFLHR